MSDRAQVLEYIIVMIDEMKAEVNKIVHNYKYGKYDEKVPDMEFLKDINSDICDHLENAEHIFVDAIPPETQKVAHLKDENVALRTTIKALQEKLNFALEIKKE